MSAHTSDISVLAEGIARVFGTAPISGSQLADPDKLYPVLHEAGARVVLSSRYDDRITVADDEQILAENTDEAFWESRAILVAPSVSFEADEFGGRCFPIDGPTTAPQLLAFFRAHVRPVIFDVDTVVLAESARRVLIAAHYGSVVLLEPATGGR